MSRLARLALCALCALTVLVGCADEPVRQGMQTADGLTFLCETVTDEKAGTVAVTVTVTNGTASTLYLSAPELEAADGTQTAAYLEMCIDTAAPSDLDAYAETGLTRRLYFAARESYTETRVFTCTLPATLTIRVAQAPGYDAEVKETVVAMGLKGEEG